MQDRRQLLFYMDKEDVPSDVETYTSDSIFNTIYIPLVITGATYVGENFPQMMRQPNKVYSITPNPSLEDNLVLYLLCGLFLSGINSVNSTSLPELCRCNGIYNCIKWYSAYGYSSTWDAFSFCPYYGNASSSESGSNIEGYVLDSVNLPYSMNKYVKLQFSQTVQIKNLDTNDDYPIYVSIEEFTSI